MILVGEQPSGSENGDGPIAGRAGRRLAGLLSVSWDSYLSLDRRNLLRNAGRWDPAAARETAAEIDALPADVVLVLLGRKVQGAFGLAGFPQFTVARTPAGKRAYLLPHPSGRCRVWNDPRAAQTARRFLRPALD